MRSSSQRHVGRAYRFNSSRLPNWLSRVCFSASQSEGTVWGTWRGRDRAAAAGREVILALVKQPGDHQEKAILQAVQDRLAAANLHDFLMQAPGGHFFLVKGRIIDRAGLAAPAPGAPEDLAAVGQPDRIGFAALAQAGRAVDISTTWWRVLGW